MRFVSALLVLGSLAGVASCDDSRAAKRGLAAESRRVVATERQASSDREPLRPLPKPPVVDPALANLGRLLFADKRFSTDDTLSCASCHDLAHGGEDGRLRPVGIRGQIGKVNTPTVFNAGLNFVQFWDGRAKTLEEQIDGPVTAPFELGSSWDEVVGKLRSDAEYQAAFRPLFGDGITAANVRTAIATFERTLVTANAPFDRWLNGNPNALTSAQKAGYELFKAVGCVACHQGANVGGNMFERFGVLGDYFADRGDITEPDYGRYNVTKNEGDRFVFRVPSLRNVEHTAPYFHDGSAPTLGGAVQIMAKYQLGRTLSDEQTSSIVLFLNSLSGGSPATVASLLP